MKGLTITYMPEVSVGSWAKSIRTALKLSQDELAVMTGVPVMDIDAFENSIPVSPDSWRRIIKLLYEDRNVR